MNQEKIIEKYINNNEKVISNIYDLIYKGFDEHRLELVTSDETTCDIMDYHKIIRTGEMLVSPDPEIDFTDIFLKMLTLLCRKGDILILDEPEIGMTKWDIYYLDRTLEILIPTYKDVWIVTHNPRLFFDADNYYWAKNYELIKITEEQLHQAVGSV